MKSYVLTLSDSQAILETVGGKGMSLAKMIQAGFPVPNGFHITTEAYRAFVDANNLQTRILTDLKDVDPTLPTTLETASASISRLFADSAMPDEIANAIKGTYLTLDTSHLTLPVAVRSSATAEDLPEASFAGQQETYLNIRGEADLLDAVKKSWASLWTARAIAYRIKNNIDQNTVALAIVVQELVEAEAAGILFTANPINGKRDEMVINAAGDSVKPSSEGSFRPIRSWWRRQRAGSNRIRSRRRPSSRCGRKKAHGRKNSMIGAAGQRS